jgi:hypothetical protein
MHIVTHSRRFWKTHGNFPSSRTSYVPARASDEDLANELNAHPKFLNDLVRLRADPAARAGGASVLALQPAERVGSAPMARRQQTEPAPMTLRFRKTRAVSNIGVSMAYSVRNTIMRWSINFTKSIFYFTEPILIVI